MNRLDRLEREIEALQTKTLLPARRVKFHQAIATLRQWVVDSDAAPPVTAGNVVARVQLIQDRLEVFFDHFADLLENEISRR